MGARESEEGGTSSSKYRLNNNDLKMENAFSGISSTI